MADPAQSLEETYRPDVSHLITEDDEPVDNWFQERQQRLLPDSLYASWAKAGQNEPFLVAADVGLFHKISEQAVVPDVMVSLGVQVPEDWWEQHNRSYMIWELGKAPDIVIEVVSNRKGKEDEKLDKYALAGVPYAVIFDPLLYLGKRPLRVYILHGGRYVEVADPSWLAEVGVGLKLWKGTYEGLSATWLRWCGQDGKVLPTGLELAEKEAERADQQAKRAEKEAERADQAQAKAEQERERAERLLARLRELGEDIS
ncbi:MAG: Uma2 family endonuclease [Vulcanimicrobiota bacterium]